MKSSTNTRRQFLKTGAVIGGASLLANPLFADEPALSGKLRLTSGWRDFSPTTRKERQAIPSACWQCVTRDAIICYVEEGRLVKIEGHPDLPRTNGKLCARGLAGVNQVYDPDRLLYPMKRMGRRGEGKWKRISWDEALDLVVNGGEIAGRPVKGLKTLRDAETPEKFMFHYGRMKGSSSKIIKSHFLAAYGTKTIGNHTSICESAKWTAQELTWGGHYDNWDLEKTTYVLNFGSNVLETHTNHIPMSQRLTAAMARGVKLVTFDVRLSNTAAKSSEWLPVRPGTDLAVILAMANVLMENGIVDREFITTYTNVTVEELEEHLRQYTPEWAADISGVPAASIRRIALEYGRARPSICIGYRGAVMHYNGVLTERAAMMLDAIAGNIDIPGGRCRATGAKWKNSFPYPTTKGKKLKIVDGVAEFAYPSHHVSHQILESIKEGSHGRPDIYMIYCYNPAYVNGNCQANIDAMRDEEKMPFIISCDVALSESSALADLLLPDATYLERWDWEDMVSANNIPEYYIRQPVVKPLGESRDFKDVCCEIANRLGIPLGFASAEEFVRDACEHTLGVKEAGGFEYMKSKGAWFDPLAKPAYRQHAKDIDIEAAKAKADAAGEEVVLDPETQVWFSRKKGEQTTFSELDDKHAAAQYIAQQCGDGKAHKAFPPDSHRWKSGFFEIRSKALADKGFPALPAWLPIPEHQDLAADQLIMTTYKSAVQTHSRTQNCKWLTELYHDNPALINPVTAMRLGIADGDQIKVKSEIGEIETKARVTEGIVPGAIAISNHCGHWEYGEYASGKKAPEQRSDDPDLKYKWWKDNGVHPNWIIPNSGDPIAGGLRWMDTVVSVRKA